MCRDRIMNPSRNRMRVNTMKSKWTDRVRSGLKAKGFVYKDLAARLNVTEGAISHYLNGIREPSINQVREIAKMLEMSLSELLGDDATFISDEKQIKAVEIIKSLPKDRQDIAIKLLESLLDEGL